MKKSLFLSILLISHLAFGQSHVLYTFGELKVMLHQVNGEWVNKSCKDLKCMALKMADESKDRRPDPKDLLGGKNPQAVKCKVFMGGKVVIGLDKRRNQQSFCAFPDGSYLKS